MCEKQQPPTILPCRGLRLNGRAFTLQASGIVRQPKKYGGLRGSQNESSLKQRHKARAPRHVPASSRRPLSRTLPRKCAPERASPRGPQSENTRDRSAELFFDVGLDGAVGSGVSHAGQYVAFSELVVIQEALVGVVNGA